MKSSVLVTIVCSIFLALLAIPANAQATRTWVSGVGDDANPCSRTAPCKTFAGAIAKTAAAGEIDCLDPGGFGGVTITKAITIKCDGVSNGGVLVSGTNGISVAAGANDHVVLSGLDFEGLGPGSSPGLNGVSVSSGLSVTIINCQIRDFTGAGGSGSGNGVSVKSSTSGAYVFIKDSFIENNGGGVYVNGNGVGNSVAIVDTVIDHNATFAVQAGTSNTVALLRSVLSNSPTAISNLGTATIVSFGPSNVIGGPGTITNTITYQ
jgi:hypothetical protein